MKAIRPGRIVLAAWLLTILYSWPGYMNWDAGQQLWEARTGKITDLYPPMMAQYWKLLDFVVRGPLLMMLLQTAVFAWGLFALLRTRLDERTAAWVAAAMLIFPPILTPMSAVWKDAHMAAFLVAGVALAMRPSRRARGLGLFLLFLAAAVRHNTSFALPPLCLLVCSTWGFRRRLTAFGAATGLCLALVGSAIAVNAALTRSHSHIWYRSIAIDDMAGTICHAGDLSDAEVAALVADTHYVPGADLQRRICADYDTRSWYSLNAIWPDAQDAETLTPRRAAWWRVVRAHPLAYLEHRTDMMAEVLGLTDEDVWEPVCTTPQANPTHQQSLHHDASPSWIQRELVAAFQALGRTIVYRAWAYAVLALVFFGYALVKRDRWLLAITGSALTYEASYFLFAPSPDFRYSHWMVVCAVSAGVVIFVERLRLRLGREAVV